jgi:4-hydroxybutyrate dehydrogenase
MANLDASMQAEWRLLRMAEAMGLGHCDPAGNTLAEAVQALNQRLGMPAGLAKLGVDPSRFERAVTGAMADHSHRSNPRLATGEDYLAVLASSL